MKKIIYTTAEGGLSIVHPVEGSRLAFSITLDDGTVLPPGADAPEFKGSPRPVDSILRRWPVDGAVAKWAETEDAFVARIRDKDVPADATDVQIVEAAAIPADRTFRNAWKAGVGIITHDMDKAREIHKDNLRRMRAPRLAALDVAYQRADESGDIAEKQRIAAEKQKLRDVTADPRIAAATDIAELKITIPEVLK